MPRQVKSTEDDVMISTISNLNDTFHVESICNEFNALNIYNSEEQKNFDDSYKTEKFLFNKS